MPTVLRRGPYRLFFYSADGTEAPHVHVERDDKIAKIWLNPIRLQDSGGFSRVEIARVTAMVRDSQQVLLGLWNDYFG